MNSRFHCVVNWLLKLNRVSCTVAFSSPGRKYSGFMKSLNTKTDCTTITVTMTGFSSGKITRKNSRNGPAPSRMAASSSSRGIVAMNAWNSRIANDSPKAISIEDQPGQRPEDPQLLQHPDRRHDGRRDDQPGQHQQVDQSVPAALPALQDERDHRAEDHHDRDAGDGQDRAVDERDDQHVVARLDDLDDVAASGCSTSASEKSSRDDCLPVLDRHEDDEDERDDEDDRRHDECRAARANRASADRPCSHVHLLPVQEPEERAARSAVTSEEQDRRCRRSTGRRSRPGTACRSPRR